MRYKIYLLSTLFLSSFISMGIGICDLKVRIYTNSGTEALFKTALDRNWRYPNDIYSSPASLHFKIVRPTHFVWNDSCKKLKFPRYCEIGQHKKCKAKIETGYSNWKQGCLTVTFQRDSAGALDCGIRYVHTTGHKKCYT